MNGLTFHPLIAPSLWLLAAIAAAAMLTWYARRRPAALPRGRWMIVTILMSLDIATVLALLLNPTTRVPTPSPPGRPLITILVDASASMRTPDAGDGQTRFGAASSAAASIARSLGWRCDVEIRTFDAAVRAADPASLGARDPIGESTDVAQAIESTLNDDRPAGRALVLLSDGIHNADPTATRVIEAAQAARTLNIPLFTRVFGQASGDTDLAIELRSTQDLALLHQKVPLSVTVRSHGTSAAQSVVRLAQDGREIAANPVSLRAGDDSQTVQFIIDATAVGIHRFDVTLDAIHGESTEANNRSPYVLRVVDEPIRALVLEGKPYWDGKFLVQTLAADPAVAVDAMIQVRPDRVLRRTLARSAPDASTTAPATQRTEIGDVLSDPSSILTGIDALQPYQIVIIGRDADAFLTPAAVNALRQWISTRGGALVCYRGSPTSAANDALAKLLPVRWTPDAETRFRLAMTERGRDLNWSLDRQNGDEAITQHMPTLASETQPRTSGPLATVLATEIGPNGDAQPAVTDQPYGAGRVVVIEGAGMWRWSFLPPPYQERETVYAALWQSLLRWLSNGTGLMSGQTFNLRADKVLFDAGESAGATLIARSDSGGATSPPSVLLRSGNDVRRVLPTPVGNEGGLFRVTFGPLAPGTYSAEIEGHASDDAGAVILFEVRQFGRELLDLQPRPDLMARIADLSGGATIGDAAGADVARLFDAHQQRSLPQNVDEIMVWDRPWVMILVIGLWTCTWIVRRRSGLV